MAVALREYLQQIMLSDNELANKTEVTLKKFFSVIKIEIKESFFYRGGLEPAPNTLTLKTLRKIHVFKGYDSILICDTWCSEYILDEGIMDLLRRLKEQNYRIISYTDGIPERVTYIENKYHFRHHFDAEVHSYEWQAVKTDMVFARALLHAAGCETNPDELLLIDDQAHETELVKELGVNVLLYRTGFLDKLVDDLRDIGIQC